MAGSERAPVGVSAGLRATPYDKRMRVSGIGWLGTRAEGFDEMTGFVRDVLGLTLKSSEPGMAVFQAPDGDLFEIFSPEHDGGGHPTTGVAGGFAVDDVRAAAEEIRAAGCEVGQVYSEGTAEWVYFRAPDGNLYELTGSRPAG